MAVGSGRLTALAFAAGFLGVDARAEPTGPSLSGTYTLDLMGDLAGGQRRGGGALHRLVLSAESALSPTWSAYGALQHVDGLDLSARVGDAQTVDNIEAPAGTAIYEAWLAGASADRRWRVRAGIVDLNRDFDVQEVGALFLNSSHGVGPELSQTTPEGPSIFPRPGWAATVAWSPAPEWRVQVGAFNGRRQDGALLIGQVERRIGTGEVQAGVWAYTERASRLDPAGGERRRNWGGYALVEGDLLARRDDAGGLRGWIRVGRSASAVNPVDLYLGGGVVREGLWREDDRLGLAVAHARFSRAGRVRGDGGRHETTFELTYQVPVAGGFVIQPNLQLVLSPSGDAALDDAVVAGLRLQASLASP